MGRLLLQEGDADGAIREHLAAVSANPRSFVGYLNLGNAYRAKGLTHEAGQAYARALQLNPSYWKAAYNLAVLAAERGDVDEAADLRREAIKMAPKEPAIYQRFTRLHLDIAKAYAAKGNSQAARHHYRAFLEAWQGDDALRQEALTALEKLDR
jgi:tetratricopeptide (TPR) repeat protein